MYNGIATLLKKIIDNRYNYHYFTLKKLYGSLAIFKLCNMQWSLQRLTAISLPRYTTIFTYMYMKGFSIMNLLYLSTNS